MYILRTSRGDHRSHSPQKSTFSRTMCGEYHLQSPHEPANRPTPACIQAGMNLQLNGKTALVTGSTAGIGLAIATALTQEGASVIVNGRTQERVDSALKSSRAAPGIAAYLATETAATTATPPVPDP